MIYCFIAKCIELNARYVVYRYELSKHSSYDKDKEITLCQLRRLFAFTHILMYLKF